MICGCGRDESHMYTVKYAYTTLMNVVNAKHMSAFETF